MQLGAIGLCLLILTVQANENTKTKEWEILNRLDSEVHFQKPNEKQSGKSQKNIKNSRQKYENGIHEQTGSMTVHPPVAGGSSQQNEPSTITQSKLTGRSTEALGLTPIEVQDLKNELESNHLNPTLSPKETFAEGAIIETIGNTNSVNTCHHIDGPRSICPEGFHSVSNKHCVLVMENQRFPPACPYPHFSPYRDIETIIDTYFSNVPIWMQISRNASSGFPDFEYIENGFLYGCTYPGNISNSNDVTDKNCLIRKNGAVYRASCSKRHTAICMYSFRQIITSSASKVCQNQHFNHCIFAHYDLTKPTCFCQTLNRLQPPKRNFCEKLAEPIIPFQTQLLIAAEEEFAKMGSKCWIGLQKEEYTGTFKWSSTNQGVSYTEWAKPYNCKLTEGAFQFGKYDYAGWTLVKDRTLSCAICEIKPNLETPRLFLDYADNKLVLYVYHPQAVSNFHNAYDVYCFSDSSEYVFKVAVGIKPIGSLPNYEAFELDTARDRPAHYWCEAFQFSSAAIVRSAMVVTYWLYDYVHEFSIHVRVQLPTKYDPFRNNVHVKVCEGVRNQTEVYYDEVVLVRPMRAYFNEKTYSLKMTIHLTIKITSKTATEELRNLLTILGDVPIITGIFSSEVCPLTTTLTPNGLVLEWPETRVGGSTIPSNMLCLDEQHDMLPVMRKCEGDFLNGGKWGEPMGTCFGNTKHSETTEELFNLLNRPTSAENLTRDLLRITRAYAENQSIDVHLIASNLEKLARMPEDKIDGLGYSRIVSNVMGFDKTTLKQAQLLLNSTDKMLSTLDNILNRANSMAIASPRLIVQIFNLQDSNIMGVGLYKNKPDANSFEQYRLSLIFKNTSLEDLTRNEQLEIAVLLPSNIPSKSKTSKLVVTAFYNDLLFNEEKSVHDLAKIMSISIPGLTGLLKFPIRILFKTPEGYFRHRICSHWQYGINPLSISIHGQWKVDGASTTTFGSMKMCEFFHMTHFAHLLNTKIEGDDRPLEIITAIGSALSLIGIVPIYLTAIFFKNWRKRPGNIILVNFCFAITLQIILTFLVYAVKKDGVLCKAVGVLLHYSTLSEFCWMLVIAILQHRRYVAVFKPREVNIVKKSLLVGWGVPLFAVMVTICISPNNYALNEDKFCFITGQYFYFGLALPVVVILSINVIIFVMIMHNISQSSVTVCVERNRNYKREILLAFLLFFMLGLSWVFGFLGTLGVGIWVTYIFCTTATLRGLVLFLYFISGNKETRLLWKARSAYFLNKKPQIFQIGHKIFK